MLHPSKSCADLLLFPGCGSWDSCPDSCHQAAFPVGFLIKMATFGDSFPAQHKLMEGLEYFW